MDEVAKQGMTELGPEKVFVVVRDYYRAGDCAVKNFAARFFCQMLLASVSVDDSDSVGEFTARFPFLEQLNARDLDRILRKVHGLSDQRIWLLADGFAACYLKVVGREALVKGEIHPALDSELRALYQFTELKNNKLVFSGFPYSVLGVIERGTGRPVAEVPLPLADAKLRALDAKLGVLYDQLDERYFDGDVPFPHMMYEVVKSCVGTFGYWAVLWEKCGCPDDLSSMKAPWIEVLKQQSSVFLGIAERYLQKWGAGSLDMESFLKEEAEDVEALTAKVGPSMMFLPMLGRTVAHPVPFYALAYEFERPSGPLGNSPTWPLVDQLRMIYSKIANRVRVEYEVDFAEPASCGCAKSKASQPRGKLVKEITFMTLQMRYLALASLNQPRKLEDWLRGWIRWCPSPTTDSIILHPASKPLVLSRSHSFSVLFDGTEHKCPRQLKKRTRRFYRNVSKYGLLMAPEKTLGFNMVARLDAVKNGKKGIVLVLVETNCINDVALAKNTASKYDGKVFVGGKPLPMAAADRNEQLQASQPTPQSAERAGDDNPTEFARQNCLHFCATRKALLSLRGVNQTLSHFKKMWKPVLHVCFVYVTLGDFEPKFETEKSYTVKSGGSKQTFSLSETIAEADRNGTTVSLHVVAGQEALENFFTAAVYHVIPDSEFHLA
jgi:hypothetical protein